MYSLIIWSADAAAAPAVLPGMSGYTVTSDGWVPAAPRDIPAELYLTVPGLCARMTVSVTPDPDALAQKQLARYAARLAASVNGAVEDCQLTGSERFRRSAVYEFPSVHGDAPRLSLALWFPPAGASPEKRAELTRLLQQLLPFALPEAYGPNNPPEYTLLQNGGIAGFDAFLASCASPVWYAGAPLTHVFLRDRAPAGAGNACGFFCIEMADGVWELPEWREALSTLLCELARLYGAFFGQIVSGERQTADWWWQGIPYDLGHVCIFSPVYASCLSGAEKAAKIGDFLLFTEPDGPYIDKKYLSRRRRTWLGKPSGAGRGYLLPADFLPAEVLPGECFRS